MSSIDPDRSEPRPADGADSTTGNGTAPDQFELAAQVELLADENRRLREEYARARQSRYQATAIGLAAVGLLATIAGLLLPDAREVLVALGATGLFGAVLTYYLTPTQVVAADVGERIYTAGATNFAAITDDLGLRDERIYVPGEVAPARLYVPQQAAYDIPDPAERAGPILVDDETRGLLLTATGGELFRVFQRTLTGELATAPSVLATQLTDALVEQFELATSANVDLDPEGGRITVAITDSALGDVDRFDHPIPSFLAVGFTAGLERPVALEVTPGDDRADWLVTCRWALEDEDAGTEGKSVTFDETAAEVADDSVSSTNSRNTENNN
ncbi:hypothetical protein [Natronorubrum tibetense]|uniref:DUF7982 domain-containing protein n=1 Tax=Natronorubrum tibetense GA33 TaxID=1114856 RepID=L9VKM3_9EURY|nr:hypothetical protein [Natronorubrum tibetense]ELY37694.1 hypothetical protein C496_19340 [Natronorubrum tibetense GA33]